MATRSSSRQGASPEVSSTEAASRPSSPTQQLLLTRKEEKLNMQNLNDRLASLIDYQRQLEIENQQLTSRITTSEETYMREVTSVRTMYEKRLNETQSALDAVINEKAKILMEADRHKTEQQNALSQLAKVNKDITALEKKLANIETELNKTSHALQDEENKRRKAEEERNSARKELDSAIKQLASTQKQLEVETLARSELETQVKSLKDKVSFERSIREEELTQSRMSTTTEIQTQVQLMQEEFNHEKALELQELREECEERFTMAINDLELKYESQINQLKQNIASKADTENKLRSDHQLAVSKCSSLESKVSSLQNTVKSLNDRIKDLESVLAQERNWHRQGLEEKDRTIGNLQDQLKQQLQEYKELYDVKVGLDMEIGTYRKLVEGEEKRLSVASAASPNVSRSSILSAGSPLNISRGSKRKVVFEETYETDVVSDAHSNCDIEINDHDQQGNYVQIHNKGTKEVPLSGWQVVRKSGSGTNTSEPKTTYKFHRSVVIKPKATITIWSASSKKEHNPPTDLLMKSQSWFVSPDFITTLVDNNSEVMAWRETKLTNKTRKRRLTGDPAAADDKNCAIM